MDKAATKENVILYESSGISVSLSGLRDYEREYHFSDRVPSGDVITTAISELGGEMAQEDLKKIGQLVEIARTSSSDFEAALALAGGLKVRVRRESKKIIRIVPE
ncbi:MAG TPA: hypothetical protein VMU60_10410 [Syntrophobacteria bacterium]|nr:hypothetical protein [Syntrophobacteria bacterium]